MNEHDPVTTLLLDRHVLDQAALNSVLERHRDTGDSVISILKRENLVSEEELTRVIASANGIEFVDLSVETIDPMVAHLISPDEPTRFP